MVLIFTCYEFACQCQAVLPSCLMYTNLAEIRLYTTYSKSQGSCLIPQQATLLFVSFQQEQL